MAIDIFFNKNMPIKVMHKMNETEMTRESVWKRTWENRYEKSESGLSLIYIHFQPNLIIYQCNVINLRSSYRK